MRIYICVDKITFLYMCKMKILTNNTAIETQHRNCLHELSTKCHNESITLNNIIFYILKITDTFIVNNGRAHVKGARPERIVKFTTISWRAGMDQQSVPSRSKRTYTAVTRAAIHGGAHSPRAGLPSVAASSQRSLTPSAGSVTHAATLISNRCREGRLRRSLASSPPPPPPTDPRVVSSRIFYTEVEIGFIDNYYCYIARG